MNNIESIWQRLQSRNQDDIGSQRRYWLDLLKGRTNLGPPTAIPQMGGQSGGIPTYSGSGPYQPMGNQIPAATGSGPYQPVGSATSAIPQATGSGPYQPQGSVGIPSYSGSGPYQPLSLPRPNIPLWSGPFQQPSNNFSYHPHPSNPTPQMPKMGNSSLMWGGGDLSHLTNYKPPNIGFTIPSNLGGGQKNTPQSNLNTGSFSDISSIWGKFK